MKILLRTFRRSTSVKLWLLIGLMKWCHCPQQLYTSEMHKATCSIFHMLWSVMKRAMTKQVFTVLTQPYLRILSWQQTPTRSTTGVMVLLPSSRTDSISQVLSIIRKTLEMKPHGTFLKLLMARDLVME